jgi:hypothetical protein
MAKGTSPQHPDEHRPQRPVLLAVDQEFGERPRPRVPPELSDPVGSLEVGERQDVEQLGAGSRTERVKALAQPGRSGPRLRSEPISGSPVDSMHTFPENTDSALICPRERSYGSPGRGDR